MHVYRLNQPRGRELLAKAVDQSLLQGLTGTFASKLPSTVLSPPGHLAVPTPISSRVNERSSSVDLPVRHSLCTDTDPATHHDHHVARLGDDRVVLIGHGQRYTAGGLD